MSLFFGSSRTGVKMTGHNFNSMVCISCPSSTIADEGLDFLPSADEEYFISRPDFMLEIASCFDCKLLQLIGVNQQSRRVKRLRTETPPTAWHETGGRHVRSWPPIDLRKSGLGTWWGNLACSVYPAGRTKPLVKLVTPHFRCGSMESMQ